MVVQLTTSLVVNNSTSIIVLHKSDFGTVKIQKSKRNKKINKTVSGLHNKVIFSQVFQISDDLNR